MSLAFCLCHSFKLITGSNVLWRSKSYIHFFYQINNIMKKLDWLKLAKNSFWISCWIWLIICKVNSVQEACAKCFLVHILKFEILQITWKKLNTEHKTLSFQFFTKRFSIFALWHFLFCFFHLVCRTSNFNMWTAKNLA